MGDRANIVVKTKNEQVCLYMHWGGHSVKEIAKSALIRGKLRWNDFQYLTRIIFCEMIREDEWKELTGYGITQKPRDNERSIVYIDVDAQTVSIDNNTWTISEFIKDAN